MEDEQVRLIKEAGECLKWGRTIRDCKSDRLEKMMKKIAANAALIILCRVNHIIVSNICDGDFDTIQEYMEELLDAMYTCFTIIMRKGEDLDELLGVEDIVEAVKYTIYEQTHEDEE